eukprot:3011558-Rhodomonas_salina.1
MMCGAEIRHHCCWDIASSMTCNAEQEVGVASFVVQDSAIQPEEGTHLNSLRACHQLCKYRPSLSLHLHAPHTMMAPTAGRRARWCGRSWRLRPDAGWSCPGPARSPGASGPRPSASHALFRSRAAGLERARMPRS